MRSPPERRIAGIVNPPGGKGTYWTGSRRGTGPRTRRDEWLQVSTRHEGSRWTSWKAWPARTVRRDGALPCRRWAAAERTRRCTGAPGSYVLRGDEACTRQGAIAGPSGRLARRPAGRSSQGPLGVLAGLARRGIAAAAARRWPRRTLHGVVRCRAMAACRLSWQAPLGSAALSTPVPPACAVRIIRHEQGGNVGPAASDPAGLPPMRAMAIYNAEMNQPDAFSLRPTRLARTRPRRADLQRGGVLGLNLAGTPSHRRCGATPRGWCQLRTRAGKKAMTTRQPDSAPGFIADFAALQQARICGRCAHPPAC